LLFARCLAELFYLRTAKQQGESEMSDEAVSAPTSPEEDVGDI